jgi:hypothetical protein
LRASVFASVCVCACVRVCACVFSKVVHGSLYIVVCLRAILLLRVTKKVPARCDAVLHSNHQGVGSRLGSNLGSSKVLGHAVAWEMCGINEHQLGEGGVDHERLCKPRVGKVRPWLIPPALHGSKDYSKQ